MTPRITNGRGSGNSEPSNERVHSPPPAWTGDGLEVHPERTAAGAAMRVARGGALGTFDVDAVIGGRSDNADQFVDPTGLIQVVRHVMLAGEPGRFSAPVTG